MLAFPQKSSVLFLQNKKKCKKETHVICKCTIYLNKRTVKIEE